MPDRTKHLCPNRKHVPWRIYDQIYQLRVPHIDMWLFEDKDDVPYFVMCLSNGGRQVIPDGWRMFYPDPNTGLVRVAFDTDVMTKGIKRVVGPVLLKRIPWMDWFHWTYIQPWIEQTRAAQGVHVSVMLHYVLSDTRVPDEPTDGTHNMYGIDDREGAPATSVPLPYKPVGNQWNPRDRSTLRTLDKLLR